ncbi:MAG: hypothetical protein II937_13635 [Bacteroidales bacterium]|nr:hypothetical protein [Bacteroidales bacterium]
MEKLIERIKYQISCFKSEKSKVGASQIDKLSLGGRIAALEELLADISTDDRPLTPEILAAAGWKSNINRRYPYKQQFRKEGERFNEYCADVAFVIFEENKVSFYYYDDTTDQKADIRIPKNITVNEFNMLLDIVKLEKFKIK